MKSFKFAALAAAMTCVACGSGGTGGTGGGTGGAGGSGGAGGGTSGSTDAGLSKGVGTCTVALADAGTLGGPDAGFCHQLPNCGESIDFQYVSPSIAAPKPTPGAGPADGLYALTAVRVYNLGTGPAVSGLKATYLKQGNTIRGAITSNGTNNTLTNTASFESDGGVTLTSVCPSVGDSMTRGYQVNGDIWLDLNVSSDRTVAYEYTRVK